MIEKGFNKMFLGDKIWE